MVFSELNPEIEESRSEYLQLRGYLRGDEELLALDGTYNAVKAPQRLLALDDSAPIDQRCESLEYVITSLHRVSDLFAVVYKHSSRRVGVGSYSVDQVLRQLRASPAFLYFDHFTNAVKHTTYVRRGVQDGVLYLDSFSYRDRETIAEPRKTAYDIIGYASDVIRHTSKGMRSLRSALEGAVDFDSTHSQVCATPLDDPNLYTVRKDET